MNTRTYLQDGIEISELGFGAWQLGVESGWKSVSDSEAERMIRTALDRGHQLLRHGPQLRDGHQ